MKEKLTALLIPVFMIALANLALYFKITIPEEGGLLLALATTLASLSVGYISKRNDQKKIGRADSIAPGITKIPPGSATEATVKIADPDVPNISHKNPETP